MEGVFIFGNETQGWYRIGRAQSIERRFAELTSIASCPLKIAAQWPCQRKYCRKLELHLQDLFVPNHIEGEWYALTPEDLATADHVVNFWKAIIGEGKDSRKLVKQVNFLVEPPMYDQLRLQAFNSHISISALIRSRLTQMTEEDFRTKVVDAATGKITMAQIIVILRGIGVLQ